jgi:hypothetical protein
MTAPAPAARRDRRGLAWAALPLVVAMLLPVAAVVLTGADAGGVLLVMSYGVPGVILAIRRPGQPIAWLLLMMAFGLLLGTTRVTAPIDELLAGTADPLGTFTAWANGIGWVFVFTGFVGISLTFPAGHLPTGRWRAVAIALGVLFVPLAAAMLFGPIINVTVPGAPFGTDVPNPYAAPGLGSLQLPPNASLWVVMFGLTVVGLLSLLVRFRRSSGLERLQYRWLAWAVLLVGVANVAWAVVTQLLRVEFAPLAALIVAVSYPAIPVAVVIAVLRYRLYEIDRLVSRSLGWALATATIVAVFVGAVLALQAALSGVTQSGTLAVAVSTLLAFALFQPVRRRVQALVDRRFDRPRLEAERILAGHGERLRQETDLERIETGVLDTVSDTLRPTSASVWIRHARAHGP